MGGGTREKKIKGDLTEPVRNAAEKPNATGEASAQVPDCTAIWIGGVSWYMEHCTLLVAPLLSQEFHLASQTPVRLQLAVNPPQFGRPLEARSEVIQ